MQGRELSAGHAIVIIVFAKHTHTHTPVPSLPIVFRSTCCPAVQISIKDFTAHRSKSESESTQRHKYDLHCSSFWFQRSRNAQSNMYKSGTVHSCDPTDRPKHPKVTSAALPHTSQIASKTFQDWDVQGYPRAGMENTWVQHGITLSKTVCYIFA